MPMDTASTDNHYSAGMLDSGGLTQRSGGVVRTQAGRLPFHLADKEYGDDQSPRNGWQSGFSGSQTTLDRINVTSENTPESPAAQKDTWQSIKPLRDTFDENIKKFCFALQSLSESVKEQFDSSTGGRIISVISHVRDAGGHVGLMRTPYFQLGQSAEKPESPQVMEIDSIEIRFGSFIDELVNPTKELKVFNAINGENLELPNSFYDLVQLIDHHTQYSASWLVHILPIRDLDKISQAFNSTSDAIDTYTREQLPRISSRLRKELSQSVIQNTGLIAAFFSSATATMMQITYQNVSTPLGVAVNTLLFSSLLFSVSSIINSVVVSAWLKSINDPVASCMPYWLSMVCLGGPKTYVLISGILFSSGLTLFAFSSLQGIVTRVVVLMVASFHAVALAYFALTYVEHLLRIKEEAGSRKKTRKRMQREDFYGWRILRVVLILFASPLLLVIIIQNRSLDLRKALNATPVNIV